MLHFLFERFQDKSLLLYGNLYFSIPWLESQFQHLLGPFSQETLRSSTKDRPSFDAWFSGFPGGSDGKVSAGNAEDLGSIPGLGRSPGGGNGNPLQYSCLENFMDRGAW